MIRFFAVCLLAGSIVFGQGTDLGTIRGTITDASGAVVPSADARITDLTTNQSQKAKVDSEGNYEASGLRSGTYRLTVSAAGFSTAEVIDILLKPGQTVRADATLRPKTSVETITILAEAPLVASESTTIATTIDNLTLVELPRDNRDIYSYLYLNPNITQGAGDGAFKFIGSQSYGASFSLDGQRSNGGVFGEPTASQPSLETIGELTVLSNNFTAEYAGIANVRITTKRGGADFHGSLFYNNKNSALAAWNLNDKNAKAAFLPTPAQSAYATPFFNLNEFGGSFSGPVPKIKRTYFMAAYEKRLQNSPVNLRNTQLPHPTLWKGDYSLLKDANKPLVPAGVTLTAAEIANNTVGGLGLRFTSLPQRLINPTTSALIQKYFPQVNPGAPINSTNGRLTDFFASLPGTVRRQLGTVRLDHDFSDKDRIYAVYNVQANTQRSGAVVSPFVGLGLTLNERSNHTLSLSETHLFAANVVNEVRGGFNSQPLFRRSNNTLREFLASIGFTPADIDAYGAVVSPSTLDTFGHPSVTFGTGFVALGTGGRNTYRPLDQSLITFGDTLTWVKGRHTFKAGADLVRNAAVDGFTSGRSDPRGVVRYTGAGPDAFARFVMGLAPNSVTFVNKFRPPMDVHNWESGVFLLDDFKIHPKLTLNLGVRYEVITPFIEANDLLVNLDPTFVGPDGKRGRFVIPSTKALEFLDPRFIAYGYTTADKAGVGRALVNTDKNNIAPRVGAAWRITDKMVLRGGYGFFYPTSAAQGIRDPLATNSFQVRLTKNNNPANPLLGWPGAEHGISPLTGGVQTNLSNTIGSNWVPFNLQAPRIEQYNITFEREIGWRSAVRVSYLGSRMHNLISGHDENLLSPSDKPFGTSTGDGVTACSPDNGDCQVSDADRARLAFPNFGDYILGFGNFGHGRSHAFQLEGNRRMAGGLMLNFSYTLLDQKSTSPDTGNASLGGTAYNQFKPENDFGDDAFTSRHRFLSYGVYQVPFGKGKKYGSKAPRAVDALAGGWESSWQLFAKTGTGFTPFWTCSNCGPVYPGNIGSGSIDATGGFYGTTFRPVVTGRGQVTSGDRIFDPSAFAPPPFGADLFDNQNVSIRHLLRGPGTWGVNLGVHKVFRLGEHVRAQLGADVNNLFNHPLKSPDNYDIGNLGEFSVKVNPTTLKPELNDVVRNPDFGRLISSYSQEGVDSRRMVRLRLRITF